MAAEPMHALVTGAAGFIGSHVVEQLVRQEQRVTAFDRLPPTQASNLAAVLDSPRVTYVQGDINDPAALRDALGGVTVVWHLGASADIPAGATHTKVDLTSSVGGTWQVLEAMRQSDARELLFASTSAVYARTADRRMTEGSGPLLPSSLYGAGKVAGEAFIAAYCGLFGLRGWIFRLGNVVGDRMPRGVIRDFILKLRDCSSDLAVLGDGRQRKSYVLVDDCIEGMSFVHRTVRLSDERPCDVFNIAAADNLGVRRIAEVVAEELGLEPPRVHLSGQAVSWPGDQPVVALDVTKVAALGWRARHDAEQAVRIASRRLIEALGAGVAP